MKLAILFWFYKEADICENRLKMLKKHNPNSKIYGLYGGTQEEEKTFKEKLNEYVDDFYTAPEKDSFKKRIHGDLSLLDRYNKRGQHLEWDSIVIAQRDLLVFDSFENVFFGIKKDQIYLPEYGIVDKQFENTRYWTSPKCYEERDDSNKNKPYMRKCFLDFKEHIQKKYGYKKDLKYCIFMLAILPKVFFEAYRTIENIELGFLEYKIPTYCEIFGINIFQKDLGERNDISPMNANEEEISKIYIQKELNKTDGRRIFHPFYEEYNE